MTIGIYKLNFKLPNKIYIGKSLNIENRYKDHYYLLKNNKHYNKKLQNAYNSLGTPTLEILCVCDIEELNSIEEVNIKAYDAVNNGLNILYKDISTLYGEENLNAKYSNNQIIQVFKLLVDCPEKLYAEIEKSTGVSKSTIIGIANSNVHTWLEESYPEKYAKLKILQGSRNPYKTAKDMGITYPPIKNPSGVIFIVEALNAFAKLHGLDKSALCKVLNKKRIQHKGWTLL